MHSIEKFYFLVLFTLYIWPLRLFLAYFMVLLGLTSLCNVDQVFCSFCFMCMSQFDCIPSLRFQTLCFDKCYTIKLFLMLLFLVVLCVTLNEPSAQFPFVFPCSAQGCHPAEQVAPWPQWRGSCLGPPMVVGAYPCGQGWGLQAWTPPGNGSFISINSSSKRPWEALDEGNGGEGRGNNAMSS